VTNDAPSPPQAGSWAVPPNIGRSAVLARTHRSANVIAVEPVETLVIETIYFEPFLLENPSVAVAILRSVVGRLRAVQARLERDR
jgi:CRP-like cAMP-binding protein